MRVRRHLKPISKLSKLHFKKAGERPLPKLVACFGGLSEQVFEHIGTYKLDSAFSLVPAVGEVIRFDGSIYAARPHFTPRKGPYYPRSHLDSIYFPNSVPIIRPHYVQSIISYFFQS